MRVTIVRSDGYVAVDGVGYLNLDMSSVQADIHAVQWDGEKGWIEFVEGADGTKPLNEPIAGIERFQPIIDVWNAADFAHKHPTPPEPVPPTAEENKATASQLLSETDWTQLPDVNLANKEEFATYRVILREIATNPVAGEIEWPVKPATVWIAA